MKRALCWLLPCVLCIALYWYGLKAWFRADDFAWLGLGLDVHNGSDLLRALFAPQAQGSIRPWSERAFFMAFYALFGLDALPFRIWVFLTQCVSLTLLQAIAFRLTGSRLAAVLAPTFWMVNMSAAMLLSWTSAYNQVMCAAFLLGAFYCLLRYIETGARRYNARQWIIFLLGFGALELNVIYPALAATYTFARARPYFRKTLPLFVPSLLYAGVHRWAAGPAVNEYALHFDLSMLATLKTYWLWVIGPHWLQTIYPLPPALVWAAAAAISGVLLGVLVWAARRADWLPLFFVAWFLIALAPLLPLRDHITEYYCFIPAIGLAMLLAYGIWQPATRIPVAIAAALYVAVSIPAVRATSRWSYDLSKEAQRLVLGVEAAHQLHPRDVILLDGVSSQLFWNAMLGHPFRLFGADQVYLTPGSENKIQTGVGWEDISSFVMAAAPALRALDRDEAVVYATGGQRLKNITSLYHETAATMLKSEPPRLIDGGNALIEEYLGKGWYPLDGNHRWTAREATVRMGGPKTPDAKLYLKANVGPGVAPATITIHADGIALKPLQVPAGADGLETEAPLPPELTGKAEISVAIQISRTFTEPGRGGRELGLAFGILQVR